ncbi:hypothetical protein [Gloeocapsopsis dulcis]|uniref:Uncharacterized protein n=1 Tax=Gloeocapsopsis dulcis AAB1 = 1H9 TaxID=1433147 RepID=A0A6N8FWE2_9CHRO|nr:hypothetical protein [Gloeocapsopsis dulcis]MUL37448.1 hypothetical protein [Gloeocapsopsis dulcis AAB1 = 1H9]WNN87423.1 hypothetical protein P0S91_13895 [Gloeocapsopsis dulcis]
MQAKQKVTLYLSPELHRKLKIRAAIDSEPMSDLAEKAIVFYLNHSEVVEETEAKHGRNHRLYHCPECETSLVMRDGDMVSVGEQPGIKEEIPVEQVPQVGASPQGEELVPC